MIFLTQYYFNCGIIFTFNFKILTNSNLFRWNIFWLLYSGYIVLRYWLLDRGLDFYPTLFVYLVVVLSGIVEILLSASLVLLAKQRNRMGRIIAAFFVLVFPGNIAQLVVHRNAFGLDSDLKRWLRLPFQFILIFLALLSTGAWQKWRGNVSHTAR